MQKSQKTLQSFEQLKKLFKPAPIEPTVTSTVKQHYILPEPEVEEKSANLKSYYPLYCTKCGKGTDRLVSVYMVAGKNLVSGNLCPTCFSRANMVELHTIADRKPIKIEPKRIEPRKLIKL